MSHGALSLRSWPRAIAHIDGDAFFASCEQALHPEYRGKPVITGKERGIVAAASYEAKALGISRGVPLWEVKKICPNAIILPSDYETYSLFSKRMFEIMRRFTPLVEEYSIDEAFAEISGLRRTQRASYETIALRMKEAIERELGITVSVGLSLSKVLAKIGSKYKKPAGFTPISGRNIERYLKDYPLGKVWGIGPATEAHCCTLGMNTALDFIMKSREFIEQHFAKPQQEIWHELRGESVYDVVTAEKISYATISKTKTFTPPSSDRGFVLAQLLKNLENSCIKARRYSLAAGGLLIFLKRQDFSYAGLDASFTRPTSYPLEMVAMVDKMFDKLFRSKTLYRATGVVLTELVPQGMTQATLFDSPLKLQKLAKLYAAIDGLAEKMGKHCVYTAGSAPAQTAPQHVLDRGDIPWRKLNRLKGETKRQHLTIPMLAHRVT
ncbi:MAG: DNA polymerase IV [Patescibacteria group bacterium]